MNAKNTLFFESLFHFLYPTKTIGGVANTFTVNFNPEIRLETYASNTVTVTRGALVYTAWIGQNISVTEAEILLIHHNFDLY